MNSRDMIGLSLKNLLRRKTRSVLAILGVVIGICAIVTMLSIGFGLQKSFSDSIEKLGNLHLITVYPGGGSPGTASKKKTKLNDAGLREIEKITGVTALSPAISLTLTFELGKYMSRDASVIGVKPEVFEMFGYELLDGGRNLRSDDKFSAVFGNAVPKTFQRAKAVLGASEDESEGRPPSELLTDKIIVTPNPDYKKPQRKTEDASKKIVYKEYKIKGVGVLANSDDFGTAYSVFIPFETAKKIKAEQAKSEKKTLERDAPYTEAMVYVKETERVRPVSDSIRSMGFQVMSMTEYLDAAQKQTRMIQMVLGGIGAVSLLVAALGITNTMVMSIYERTKEIGVMKVIGANLPDIRKLFLIEAALIGLVGGLVGVGLSYMISAVMNLTLSSTFSEGGGNISLIPLWLPAAALGFSTAVGVASGYSPARRAMNLSALESLRNE